MGDRVGHWTIISSIPIIKGLHRYWLCRCDCGTEREVRGCRLQHKLTKSCGCTKKVNYVGKSFGFLTVKKEIRTKGKETRCICVCKCGNEIEVGSGSLVSGNTKSCGCLSTQTKTTHGMYGTRFYNIWKGIKQRCYDIGETYYLHYGGRGITTCERWKKFENFRDDMYDSYLNHIEKFGEKQTTIDRIDVDGNYEPENCKWSTLKEQNNNKRTNINLTYNGESHSLIEWSYILGICKATLSSRLYRGWSTEKTLSTPLDCNYKKECRTNREEYIYEKQTKI